MTLEEGIQANRQNRTNDLTCKVVSGVIEVGCLADARGMAQENMPLKPVYVLGFDRLVFELSESCGHSIRRGRPFCLGRVEGIPADLVGVPRHNGFDLGSCGGHSL